ncbi:putative serine protease K12H4.7 [Dendroctonus ponderosae]|uniref:Serine protease K12H4.7 n=1 Tax=Dendroctonus ponderosae TaxID=77166 RepID=A0AAR5Q533_DENPD|nr:putative serine protease K12H4.7 [Dendroctonus ponderosae]
MHCLNICFDLLAFTLIFKTSHVAAVFGVGTGILFDPPDSANLRTTGISSDLYFEQRIDHFNPTDSRTYQQRYHLTENYYNESSTNHVFLMLGGEWEATSRWLTYGTWIETAKHYGALLMYLEHRYYGQSQPFSDLSTENMQYLSSHQALADAAAFIEGMNDQYNLTDANWIVFGASYAGTLAAWLRHKYPHLVAGAMSSSAPLNAILDFNEYLEVVANGLGTHSQTCIDNVKEAYDQLEELVTGCLEDEDAYNELDEMFKLCDSIQASEGNDKDLTTLFQILTDSIFAHVVQYHRRPSATISINTICEIMVNDTAGATKLKRLAEVNALLLENAGSNCRDFKYANLVAGWSNTTIVASSMMRQWVYQTCTEFGFFQTSTQDNPIFGTRFNITYFTDLCIDLFGEEFNETLSSIGIQTTNTRYGAANIATSKIVYFHGSIDPWHVLGKLSTTDDVGDKVIIVEGVAHCANMIDADESDPEELNVARAEIRNLIGQWLGVVDASGGNSVQNGYILQVLILMLVIKSFI